MLAALMLALLIVGITTVLLSAQAVQRDAPSDLRLRFQHTAPSRPTDGATPPGRTANVSMAETSSAVPAEATPVAATVDASQAGASVQAARLAVGRRARVAHTDGVGVVLHSTPNTSARRPAGLLEGAAVTVLELVDGDWARVQSDSRQTGWVPAAFLVGE